MGTERRYRTVPLPKGSTIYWVLCFTDGKQRIRWHFGLRPLVDQLQIKVEGGRNLRIIPDRPLWSGISWAVVTLEEAAGSANLAITTNQTVKDFEVQVYLSTAPTLSTALPFPSCIR
jgi:hypothetical protein